MGSEVILVSIIKFKKMIKKTKNNSYKKIKNNRNKINSLKLKSLNNILKMGRIIRTKKDQFLEECRISLLLPMQKNGNLISNEDDTIFTNLT